jgi:hypothetical protein
MADVDDLARRLVALVMALAGRGIRWALRVALVVGLAAAVMYLLGLAAIGGTAWAVFGAVVAIAAVGAPLLAAWRLREVTQHADALVGDVRSLMAGSTDARRVVVETVETGQPTGDTSIVVYQSRDFSSLRDMATSADLRSLPGALRAVTTYPFLLLVGILATILFGFASLIFLIALAF